MPRLHATVVSCWLISINFVFLRRRCGCFLEVSESLLICFESYCIEIEILVELFIKTSKSCAMMYFLGKKRFVSCRTWCRIFERTPLISNYYYSFKLVFKFLAIPYVSFGNTALAISMCPFRTRVKQSWKNNKEGKINTNTSWVPDSCVLFIKILVKQYEFKDVNCTFWCTVGVPKWTVRVVSVVPSLEKQTKTMIRF